MDIEYLKDREEFIPEIARLHHEEWGYLHPRQILEDRIERLRTHCGHRQIPTVLIATKGEEVLGTAMLLMHDMEIRRDLSPWLAGVYVKPVYRRQGIASQLICRIEEEAAVLGICRLYLYTPSSKAFYSMLGWQLLERCEYKNVRVSIMQKTVRAQPVAAADSQGRDNFDKTK
jgi:N-acetylglutamate synthase-like GNAT family acetyltransferase